MLHNDQDKTQADLTDSNAQDAETKAPAGLDGKSLDAIFGVKLDVRVVLGRSRMPISELLNLTKGSVIELDRRVGEPVDIMINDRMVARGDLVRVQGDSLGVALREIVKDISQKSDVPPFAAPVCTARDVWSGLGFGWCRRVRIDWMGARGRPWQHGAGPLFGFR